LRHPECAWILVDDIPGREGVVCGRCGDGLSIRQQHPAGEELLARLPPFRRQPVGKVAEPRVDIHMTIGVEPRGLQADAPLETPVHADSRCAGAPPVAEDVLERVAMARALHDSDGLVGRWIVGVTAYWAM